MKMSLSCKKRQNASFSLNQKIKKDKNLKLALICGLLISLMGCSNSNQIGKKDKENINIILQTIVTQKNNLVIDDFIYIHVMDLDDIHYRYDDNSKPEKINTTGAYEIKLKSSNNYIYIHAYMTDEDNKLGFVYNKETMKSFDKFYFTDKEGDRLKYYNVKDDYINDEILDNY
ncbi:MAG: hypothetical protein ACLRYM_14815 [Thomasclavelia ramosa]